MLLSPQDVGQILRKYIMTTTPDAAPELRAGILDHLQHSGVESHAGITEHRIDRPWAKKHLRPQEWPEAPRWQLWQLLGLSAIGCLVLVWVSWAALQNRRRR